MLGKFADWIIARAQKTPYVHLPGYMMRYWIFPYGKLPFGIAVRVHQILRSDSDRHYHDHPFPYISIVLRGGYVEVTPCSLHNPCTRCERFDLYGGGMEGCSDEVRKLRRAGSIAFRRADSWHRLELIEHLQREDAPRGRTPALYSMRWTAMPCWTLFITGPQRQDAQPGHAAWGFLVDGEKVPADVYLGDRYIPTDYSGAST